MASSTHQNHQQQHFQNPTTSAPPPTPSTTHPNPSTSSAAADLLSRLLHRLPPTLSTTPLRRKSSSTTISPQTIPYTNLSSTLSSTIHSISELGYFQLTDHPIPPQLARSAQTDSLSIFKEKKHHFTKNWPVGFNICNEDEDHDEEGDNSTDSLFLDSDSLSDSSDEFSLSSLHGFMHAMEKVGLSVVEGLTCAMGLQVKDAGVCTTSLLWLGDGDGDGDGEGAGGDHQLLGSGSGRFYPYVVGLHYMHSSGRCGLVTDSGLVSVKTQVDSILVTLGDIAQVWSNGKLKKVRGKPTITMEEGNSSSSLSMSLLVTLPLESTVSPLLPRAVISNHDDTNHNDNQNQDDQNEPLEESMFSSFSFEDYAWRVYHERVHLKDPLDRYRIQT